MARTGRPVTPITGPDDPRLERTKVPRYALDYIHDLQRLLAVAQAESQAADGYPDPERVRAQFLKRLTLDGSRDGRRWDFNQAIFDPDKGFAVFEGTDLDMVLRAFDTALNDVKRGRSHA